MTAFSAVAGGAITALVKSAYNNAMWRWNHGSHLDMQATAMDNQLTSIAVEAKKRK